MLGLDFVIVVVCLFLIMQCSLGLDTAQPCWSMILKKGKDTLSGNIKWTHAKWCYLMNYLVRKPVKSCHELGENLSCVTVAITSCLIPRHHTDIWDYIWFQPLDTLSVLLWFTVGNILCQKLLKIYEWLIFPVFHLLFLKHVWLLVTESTESTVTDFRYREFAKGCWDKVVGLDIKLVNVQ